MKLPPFLRRLFEARRVSPSPDLAALREQAMSAANADTVGKAELEIVSAWIERERSSREVVRILKKPRGEVPNRDVIRLVGARIHPACVDWRLLRLFRRPLYGFGFLGLCENPGLDKKMLDRLAEMATGDLLLLLWGGIREEDIGLGNMVLMRTEALDKLICKRGLAGEVPVERIAATLLKRKKKVAYESAAHLAGALFGWRQLDDGTFNALYELIMDGDGGRYPPDRTALLRLGVSAYTPLAVVQRLLEEGPSKLKDDAAVVLASINKHAAADPVTREHIMTSDNPAAIELPGMDLSSSDKVLAIRRIRELGAWPSAGLVAGCDPKLLDRDLIADLLTCPDGAVRSTVIVNVSYLIRGGTTELTAASDSVDCDSPERGKATMENVVPGDGVATIRPSSRLV